MRLFKELISPIYANSHKNQQTECQSTESPSIYNLSQTDAKSLCSKDNSKSKKNQDIHKPLDSDFQKDPEKGLSNLPSLSRRILDLFIQFRDRYQHVYPSQDFIARTLGISRTTAIKNINILRDLGLVYSKYNHRQACDYDIAPMFNDIRFRSKVCRFFQYFLRGGILALYIAQASAFYEANNYRKDKNTPFKKNVIKNKSFIYSAGNEARESNMATEKNPISKAILELQIIKPTRWGQIRLMVFPEEAIKYAEEQLAKAKDTSRDQFSHFWFFAEQWCERHDVPLDFKLVYDLEKLYKKPTIAPMLMYEYAIDPKLLADEDAQPKYKAPQKALKQDPKTNKPQALVDAPRRQYVSKPRPELDPDKEYENYERKKADLAESLAMLGLSNDFNPFKRT